MTRAQTTEGQALWQPGGAEQDSHFREGNRHLRLAYEQEEAQLTPCAWDESPFPQLGFQ